MTLTTVITSAVVAFFSSWFLYWLRERTDKEAKLREAYGKLFEAIMEFSGWMNDKTKALKTGTPFEAKDPLWKVATAVVLDFPKLCHLVTDVDLAHLKYIVALQRRDDPPDDATRIELVRQAKTTYLDALDKLATTASFSAIRRFHPKDAARLKDTLYKDIEEL